MSWALWLIDVWLTKPSAWDLMKALPTANGTALRLWEYFCWSRKLRLWRRIPLAVTMGRLAAVTVRGRRGDGQRECAGKFEKWASGRYLYQCRLRASGPSTAKVCKTLILNLLMEGKIYNLYTSVTFSRDESGHMSLSCRSNNHVRLWLNTSAVKSPTPNRKQPESRCLKAAAWHFSSSNSKEPRRLWFSLFSERTKDSKRRDQWL